MVVFATFKIILLQNINTVIFYDDILANSMVMCIIVNLLFHSMLYVLVSRALLWINPLDVLGGKVVNCCWCTNSFIFYHNLVIWDF